MEVSLFPQSEHGMANEMVADSDGDDIGSMSSFSEDEDSSRSNSSTEEDATSSSLNSSASPPSRIDDFEDQGPLCEMSSLITQLPFKRGLSKHFQGKSQSFTSLSNVKSLEDLVKLERPCKKKLKSCKSYCSVLDGHHKQLSPKSITKKHSRSTFSLLGPKRNSFNRPPLPPHRSGSMSGQTFLFI
ncbi:uncharacterized protein LOC109703961 [Ananas comosus]|uniref:Uncharacterized protein LOC109703961 n=1 Tax=Ananas comosus TaxID=4615 RepID=A0A6P5EB12_ANACO|nr:uncharacterized protein LOC109703961 [Ananas comosus]